MFGVYPATVVFICHLFSVCVSGLDSSDLALSMNLALSMKGSNGMFDILG